MANKTIPAKAMDIIKKYPELKESVKEYLATAAEEKESNLNIDALKMMEEHSDVKPLEGIFNASAGADGVPGEIMSVLRKYPEFEEKVNAFLKTAAEEKKTHLSIDALNVLEEHAGIEAASVDISDETAEGLKDIISKYPEAEKELKEYMALAEKEKELNVSVDALKVFEK